MGPNRLTLVAPGGLAPELDSFEPYLKRYSRPFAHLIALLTHQYFYSVFLDGLMPLKFIHPWFAFAASALTVNCKALRP